MRNKIDIVIVGFGTKGDVYPLIAIARELTNRGIETLFISTNNYKNEILASGATFFCASKNDEYTEKIRLRTKSLDPIDYDHIFKKCIVPTFGTTYRKIESIYKSNKNIKVIRLGVNNGAHLACEKLNIPYFEVALTPIWFKSCLDPGWPLNQFSLPIRYAIAKFLNYWNSKRHPYLRIINDEREKVGLPRAKSMQKLKLKKPELTFAMFPTWFGMPQGDWPKNISTLSFPMQDKINDESRNQFDDFISKNDTPLIFTLGSEMFNCELFFKIAYKVCKNIGVSGVFINPMIDKFDLPQTETILKLKYIDFGYVFSKTKLIVHHGGIGTCAQALLAGKPQIICPLQYDQPDNGWRISKLGVGGMITKDQLTETNLSTMIKEILDSDVVRVNVSTYSSMLHKENNPITKLVDKIQQYSS